MTARRLTNALLGLVLLSLFAAPPASAIVSRLTVESRQDVLGGRPFGTAGAYEKLVGVVEFALDPANAANAAIVDLAGAPRDSSSRVTASANFVVLRPKTMPCDRSVALLEVSNRGGRAMLPYFARAAWSTNLTTEAELGDALPLRLGLTLMWVGWQFDVLEAGPCAWTRPWRRTVVARSRAWCARTGRWTRSPSPCRSVTAATAPIRSPTRPVSGNAARRRDLRVRGEVAD